MLTAIMAMLIIITTCLWIVWVSGILNKIHSLTLRPIVYALIVLTPFTVAYGTHYGNL